MSTSRVLALVLATLVSFACDGPPSAAPPAAPTTPASTPGASTTASTPASTPAASTPGTPTASTTASTASKPTPDEPDEPASFADPKTAAEEQPPATPRPPVEPALAARISKRFGERCTLARSCGDLLGIDCQSAVDGPYYYAQRTDLKTVATCGGACRGRPCPDCPPKAWTCPAE